MIKYIPHFQQLFHSQIVKEMMEELNYRSSMQVPYLEKIVLSMGVGEALQNKNLLEQSISELTLIVGQKAVKTRARKSEAAFKIRAGMAIGAKVTLRGRRMYDFLYRLVHIALPRTKDFRGINTNAFDGHGNYSLGVKEQIVFPEIDYDKIERISGLNITIVTTSRSDQEARVLLGKFNMPFQKRSG